MGTRRRRMRSRRHRMRKHKHRMNPPDMVKISSSLFICITNRVNMLEDLLERSQESFDKRLEQLQLENNTLGQQLAFANLGQSRADAGIEMDDDEDEAFAEFLAAQDS